MCMKKSITALRKAKNKRIKNRILSKGYVGIVTARIALAQFVTNRKTNGRIF